MHAAQTAIATINKIDPLIHSEIINSFLKNKERNEKAGQNERPKQTKLLKEEQITHSATPSLHGLFQFVPSSRSLAITSGLFLAGSFLSSIPSDPRPGGRDGGHR